MVSQVLVSVSSHHLPNVISTDIYVAAVSHTHNVAAKGIWIAIVSTIVETSVPERELLPGLQLLGTIHDKYVANCSCRAHEANINLLLDSCQSRRFTHPPQMGSRTTFSSPDLMTLHLTSRLSLKKCRMFGSVSLASLSASFSSRRARWKTFKSNVPPLSTRSFISACHPSSHSNCTFLAHFLL